MALNYLILGEKIRELRSKQKISQASLAEMIDKSPTFVSRMERGLKGPSLETLVLIADSLKTSVDALLENNRMIVVTDSLPGLQTAFFTCSAYEQFILSRSLLEIRRILREGESIRKLGS